MNVGQVEKTWKHGNGLIQGHFCKHYRLGDLVADDNSTGDEDQAAVFTVPECVNLIQSSIPIIPSVPAMPGSGDKWSDDPGFRPLADH